MSTIEQKIDRVIAMVQACNLDDEFVLRHAGLPGEQKWCAEVVNMSVAVQLGEAEAKYWSDGPTMDAALDTLIDKLERELPK